VVRGGGDGGLLDVCDFGWMLYFALVADVADVAVVFLGCFCVRRLRVYVAKYYFAGVPRQKMYVSFT